MVVVYTVKHPYNTSCKTLLLSQSVTFAFADGYFTAVTGCLSSRSSRSGVVGGLIAYPIGTQQLTRHTSHKIGGHAACVRRYIRTPLALLLWLPLPVKARTVLRMTATSAEEDVHGVHDNFVVPEDDTETAEERGAECGVALVEI